MKLRKGARVPREGIRKETPMIEQSVAMEKDSAQ
jgi:hypothetical protein